MFFSGLDMNEILFRALAFLIGITVHEFAHGFVAYRLGDPTPKAQGRLTLNPIAHMELIGTLMILFAPIGWAKPVQFNPQNFKGNKRLGTILTTMAGPVANLIIAIVFACLLMAMERHNWITDTAWHSFFLQFMSVTFSLNLYLFLFNLIPIPPLDGYWILRDLLPRKVAYDLTPFEKYGSFILLLFIFLGLFDTVLSPIFHVLATLIIGLFGWV
ncbi:site-2 protease family protein [Tumebacillus permanentifrigoris]|uniref:Zn-dependent protease n=1 Tax=Tumebacillus permanentifrigoris TaxID=378543 RepID=A0A316DX79_9BACL|nr:site-2 protease family protein [Tumebacillus permanentifrigoris]PWK14444.1 Zn-dependent protease [Tumebacillus permanentifrigoris]